MGALLASGDEGKTLLQRLFPAFPGGLPGMALLLLRAVFALSLVLQARTYLGSACVVPANWIVGLAGLAAGVLLLIGFLTPIAGAVAGLAGLGVGFSLFPACTPILFDSGLAVALAAATLVGIIVLGPGAFSLDARLFGRREIIIPRANVPARR